MTRDRVAGALSLVLAAGIAVSVLLGPLMLGAIHLHTSEAAENQFVGGEIVSLGVVAPLLVVAGSQWLRHRSMAAALAVGPALYCAYTYITAIVGQEYARYDGNAERYVPLYLALVAGGAALAVLAIAELVASEPRELPARLRTTAAVLLVGIGAFFALAWSGQIRQVLSGQPTTDHLDTPTLFWLIKVLDLGLVIPAFLATGIGLFRHSRAAARAVIPAMTFGTCMGSAVAAMALTMAITGDPASEALMLAVVVPVALLFAAVTVTILVRTYVHGTVEPAPPARQTRDLSHPPANPVGPRHA